ncbi:MAG: ATP-binding protein [Desulfopila sp.]|nr:ATP-binding protein [Desulfopila sp.]
MGAKYISNQGFSIALALQYIESFSAQLATAGELEKLYSLSLRFIKETYQLDYSTLLLLDTRREKLVMRATIGFPENMVNTFSLRLDQGLPSLALKTCKVETVENFRLESRFEVTPLMEELGISSAIAVPMLVADTVIGVFIGHTREQRFFYEIEKQVCQVLANHAGIAINNALLLTSLQRSERRREKKIVELQLEKLKTRELSDEFESIFTTITAGVILLKNNSILARCNEKCAEILGYESASRLQNTSARELHPSDAAYREFAASHSAQIAAGSVIQTECILRKKNGDYILCSLSGKAVDQMIPPDLGKGVVWLIEDITRQRRMEKEVLQARKLESIGILAAGIGHDYNNILSVILGNLGLARRILEAEHNVQEMLGSAIEAADRAKELTAKLLMFTRKDTQSPGSVNLAELFKSFEFESLLQNTVDLAIELQEGLFSARILPEHLKVVLQNLLQNADNCMQEEVRIKLTGHNVEILQDDLPGIASGKYVEVSVADNGPGIDQTILDNIFDPYFSTKSRDSTKGIGLGLAIVHAIVTKNHGSISVRSRPNGGTVFTVLLPAAC